MNELLKKDIIIKILSVVFAIVLWFVINPIQTRTISVYLTVKNEDTLKNKNLILKNKNYSRTVEVVIRGNNEKIKNVTRDDFEASIDFSKITSVYDTELKIDGPKYIGKEDGIIIKDVLQTSVQVELQRLEKDAFVVEGVISGSPKPGYKVVYTDVSPNSIVLQGADALIKSAASIKTVIDVSNIDRDIVQKKQPCKVYDINGKEILELSQDLYVDVTVHVGKEVAVTAAIKGSPAINYVVGEIKTTPEKLLITGSPEVLSKINELKTSPVDIDGASKNIEEVSSIVFPTGVKAIDAQIKEVTVNVGIQQSYSKEITIPKSDISIINKLDDSFTYEIKDDSITVKLWGPEPALNLVSIDSLNPFIDASGFTEGAHRATLKVRLPYDARLDRDYYVNISISKIADTNAETEQNVESTE
ncbi:YbbR domain-containing protein [Anaerobacterium chartisolvens]|uniref:YbbR domain-containing protein n=1 Tax=Anaerobacterium chartisolvens TaxID=1297424 RepID=A0A369B9I8_9FIRM|nr:CdaR family protein [Anaerobacterium chartisolvens]RCX17226.1 YbbR domain-containing protein [Anaerobacterium chartisolvens]